MREKAVSLTCERNGRAVFKWVRFLRKGDPYPLDKRGPKMKLTIGVEQIEPKLHPCAFVRVEGESFSL